MPSKELQEVAGQVPFVLWPKAFDLTILGTRLSLKIEDVRKGQMNVLWEEQLQLKGKAKSNLSTASGFVLEGGDLWKTSQVIFDLCSWKHFC